MKTATATGRFVPRTMRLGRARQRCWQYDWVIDLDIKGFFDNIPHDLLIRAVRKHARRMGGALH